MASVNRSGRNERRKLTASYLNTLSAAVMTVGAIAPLASVVYGNTAPSPWVVAIAGAICIAISLSLHFGARWLLGGIEE
jgi:hypothetical protein